MENAPNVPNFTPEDIKENAIWAAASYLWILSLVVILSKKDSAFAHAHAQQGFVLFIASLILSFIPVLGWLVNIVVAAFCLIGLVNAAQGKFWPVPLVADIAKKINL